MRSAIRVILSAFAVCGTLHADPVSVHYVQGTTHGLLRLETLEGKPLANGDLIQTVQNGRVTTRLVFKFRDGSVDEETTVYTQNHVLKMVSDRHIQKGPAFPHSIDLTVLASGKVTSTSTGEDGKTKQTDEQMDLPPDIANGMSLVIVTNVLNNKVEARVGMVQVAGKPIFVHAAYSPAGEEMVSIGGATRKADVYTAKIEIGGIKGVIAPIVGKAPKDYRIWFLGGPAPAFLKSEGQLYAEGPVVRIRQISATFPATGE